MAGRVQTKFLGFLAAVVLVSAAAEVSPAHAQGAARNVQEQACSRDVSRYCRKQMKNGDSAIHQCLLQNREKLGASCRKVIEGR